MSPSRKTPAPARDRDRGNISNHTPESCHTGDPFQAEISIFKNANAKTPMGARTIESFISINIGRTEVDDIRSAVEAIRQAVDDFAPREEIDQLKKALPAASISGKVTEGGRAQAMKEGRFQHSGFLQIDLDGKDFHPRSPEAVRDGLRDDPHIQGAFLSPTGTGVKAVFSCGVCRTAAEHRAAFLAAEIYFKNAHGLQIDPSTKDPVRFCFFSHDADGWMRDGVAAPLPLPTSTPSSIIAPPAPHHDLDAATVRDMLRVIPPRPDYDHWLRIASAVWAALGEADGTAALVAWSPEEHDGEYAKKFAHRLKDITAGSLWHFAKENGWRREEVSRAIRATAGAFIGSHDGGNEDLTAMGEADADNAARVHAKAGGNFHFVSQSGQWILWDGCRWRPDNDGAMVRLYLHAMEATAQQGLALKDYKAGERVVKHAMKSRDASKVRAALEMLKAVSGVTIQAHDLDSDPWLLGTPNGLIDLRTGRAMPPQKAALVTKTIACDLDARATCPTWEMVVATSSDGDGEIVDFLQRWFGYTLTGSVREECLTFLHGIGANGKGTIVETARFLLGDYAITAPESLFVTDRNTAATNDIARLAGCRMACAAELDEGASFAESRLKAITARDAITARFLHKEFFDFLPTHKLWVSGNHKPAVRGTDTGIWRRLRLIPFTHTVPREERDLRLADKLRAELPGVLNWALAGCLRWQAEGLPTPRRVQEATDSYRENEDILGQFFGDRIIEDEGALLPRTRLYEEYQDWALGQGIRHPWNARNFNRKVEERGGEVAKYNGTRCWRSLAIT